MDTKNLWRALVKSEAKTEIFCPSDLNVSIDDFFSALKKLILDNKIPADIDMLNVTWDNTDFSQKRIIVKYSGNETKMNTQVEQFLIGLDQFGNYTYIEEKIFLDKPLLPKFPLKRDPTPRPGVNPIAAFFAFLFYIIPGFIYLMVIDEKKTKYDETIGKHNELADKEQEAWNHAWNSWEHNMLQATYLGVTNDIFGRFIKAISSLVQTAIKILFEEKKQKLKIGLLRNLVNNN